MPGLRATGTTLTIDAGTTVVQVESITGPSMTATSIDVSAHDSPNKWREFVPGMKDGGEITLEINWDMSKASHRTNILGGTDGATGGGIGQAADTAIITWAGATGHTVQFQAFITAWNPGLPVDDKQTASVKLKCTGAPTFGAGS